MIKTLTKQWRDGTLETGWYYTKHDDGKIYIWLCFKDDCSYIENPEVKEILAPVPSYDKVKEMSQKVERLKYDNEALETSRGELVQKMNILEKKLKIAKKALKDIQVRSQRDWDEYSCMSRATRALYDIEMEGVK